jgi:hypothetical protein
VGEAQQHRHSQAFHLPVMLSSTSYPRHPLVPFHYCINLEG